MELSGADSFCQVERVTPNSRDRLRNAPWLVIAIIGDGLTASPLGVRVGRMLPHTKTDQHGKFRFADIPWWGRYTVFADDEKAGYSQFSNGPNDPASTKEVTLSPKQPGAEFNLFLLRRLASSKSI